MKSLFDHFRCSIADLFKSDTAKDRPVEHDTATAAFYRETEAKPLHAGRRRLKENYTSHWDLDYLPRNQVDALIDEIEREPRQRPDD